MEARNSRAVLFAAWCASIVGSFAVGRAQSRSGTPEPGGSPADTRNEQLLGRAPDAGPLESGGIAPPAAARSVAAERIEERSSGEVDSFAARVEGDRRWAEDRADLRRTRKAMEYLITELGPHRRASISMRPALLQLTDESGRFGSETLRSCLLYFVAGHPLELSDGEIIALAPIVAGFYRERTALQDEGQGIDGDPTLTPETRETLSEEIRVKRLRLWRDFVASLVGILGAERGSMFE